MRPTSRENFNIEVVALDNSLIQTTSKLLADYIYPLGWDNILFSECEESLLRLIAEGISQVYIAKSDIDLMGFVVVNWGFSTTKGKPILRIQDLYTALCFRNKGVAESLLGYCEDLAMARGANRIQLETGTSNIPARKLYEKMGFEWMDRKEVYMKFFKI